MAGIISKKNSKRNMTVASIRFSFCLFKSQDKLQKKSVRFNIFYFVMWQKSIACGLLKEINVQKNIV